MASARTSGGWGLWILLLFAACGREEPAGGMGVHTSAGSAAGTPWLREEALERGIRFRHRSGHRTDYLFPELMGGGAALFDMDGDGDLDLFLVQSGSLIEPEQEPDGHKLYENVGGGRFRDVSATSGIALSGYGMGVATGDYDGDGDTDLYITNLGANQLYSNEGGGRFRDVTAEAGVGDEGWSMSAAFLDYDRDGDQDLFVTNYVRWSRASEKACFDPTGKPDYCSPTEYQAPAQDGFYENQGAGRFRDATEAAGLRRAFGNGLGVVAADFDDDGFPDLLVANDQTPNLLWMNQRNGTFRESAGALNCAVDQNGRARAGMGVDAIDLDDDLDLDFIVVNMARENDGLFENQGSYFGEITTRSGLARANRTLTRFGVGFEDFDNDGLLDLYVANGRVNMLMPPIDPADPYSEPNSLLRGAGKGQWEEVLPTGGTSPVLSATSRGAAFGDVDEDGGVDVVVVNRDAPAHLLRNVLPERGHWLEIDVLDERGGPALGARVLLRVGARRLRRDVHSASSYCSASAPRLHIGLGPASAVEEARVRWVDGGEELFGPFASDRIVTLRHGTGRKP